MIELAIPGKGEFRIKSIVFDVNGTLALGGKIDENVKKRLQQLAKNTKTHIITADTYGTIEKEMQNTGISIHRVTPPGEAEQKEKFVKSIGEGETLALGNGANDALMLKTAALGICVIDAEGASAKAISSADIVVLGTDNALGLLENPTRMLATLRS